MVLCCSECIHTAGILGSRHTQLPHCDMARDEGGDGLGVGGDPLNGVHRAGHDHGAQDRLFYAGWSCCRYFAKPFVTQCSLFEHFKLTLTVSHVLMLHCSTGA